MRNIAILFVCLFKCIRGYLSDMIPEDYNKLVDYANIATIGYCLKGGRTIGTLGNKGTRCMLEICNTEPYENIEIRRVFDFKGDVCSGYYALDHDNERILLVFRGTSSRRDWFKNLDIFPVKYEPLAASEMLGTKQLEKIECENCKVHRGYYNILKENCPEIIRGVVDLKAEYSDYTIAVVGHSLGGALAILSGIELQLMGHDTLVVSFASPKVGNKNMAEYIDKTFYTPDVAEYIFQNRDFNTGFIRVVHAGDTITKLPPTKVYRHCGFEYFIDKKYTPHTPSDVEPRGASCCNLISSKEQASITSVSYNKLWSINTGKYEHNYYFRKITNCDLLV